LQQREYEPVGGTSPKKADIRIIAATNRDLKELVAQGKFRDDLYFRLAVVKIELPPLKDRREDIPYLVDHFIRKYNARRGKKIISISPDVMDTLLKYDFPGNIRELENIIEYGFVVCKNSIIQKEHLPTELFQKSKEVISETRPNRDLVGEAIDERSRIESVLLKHKGKITEAAEELGMHRTTLWRKIRRHNIDIKK
jgi:transcriptional regulator with PAS, ATPase and Fis domain